MTSFLSELFGTMILILLGDGVVANVLLAKTKGNNSGWIVITFGWAIAVFAGVVVSASGSASHLNPAITIAMAAFNGFPWSDVPVYIAGQMLGAMLGSFLVWVSYKKHYDETVENDLILATFCTGPAIRSNIYNFLSEMIATFALVFGILYFAKPSSPIGSIDAVPVALLVLGLGLSLGGTTGYAINPARDLGPRIMHAILPIKNKGTSNWDYSWVPIMGSIVGACLAGLLFTLLSNH